MNTFADSFRTGDKRLLMWTGGALVLVVGVATIATPNLMRSRSTAEDARAFHQEQLAKSEPIAGYLVQSPVASISDAAPTSSASAGLAAQALPERRIIRNSSLELVVQHPAEVAEKIAALAERFGGYLENSQGGGDAATSGTLTIRIPAARFNEARSEIHKLGLRVETESVDAQDVTQRYVDQEATLRNLHAEETQYLLILKQAATVKDLLAVSEKLSEVRGEIERQQAEFNALSKQTETVAIAVSLRTEAEAQVLGLNWRPLYQLKIAFRDGLESLATYATAMISILFYLPAVLLWCATVVAAIVGSWKGVRWVGHRWLGWTAAPALDSMK